jgi:hypothetical protein
MGTFNQTLAHAECGSREHQRRAHGSRAAPAEQEIGPDKGRHHDCGLAQDHGRKTAQLIEPCHRQVEQPSAVQIGLVGKGEREEIAAGHMARAQDLLAIRQAKEEIGLLQWQQAQSPATKRTSPSSAIDGLRPILRKKLLDGLGELDGLVLSANLGGGRDTDEVPAARHV